jgi:hypothetical protein
MMITTNSFPQADRIDQVGMVTIAVSRGHSTDDQIESFIKLDSGGRQGRYYRHAAEILGLIVNKGNHSILTPIGEEFSKLKSKTVKSEFLAYRIIETPVFRKALDYIYHKKPDEKKLKLWFNSYYPGSHSTAERRYATFISYLTELNVISINNNLFEIAKYFGALERKEHNPLKTLSGKDISRNIKDELLSRKEINILYEVNAQKREQANQMHWKLVISKSSFLSKRGFPAKGNDHIDLFSKVNNNTIIYEMKSINAENILSQIRKGISQLYEYRYIYSTPGAKLCIVGNHNIGRSHVWLLNYLTKDRLIAFEWTDNYQDFYCDHGSKSLLKEFAP